MNDDLTYLDHIANSFRKLLEYAEEMTLAEFLDDSKTQDACVRQLEIAGEATKNLSTSIRKRFTDVPWKDMAGMRDRLIHQYIDVDLMIVWMVITENATPLLISVERIIDTLEQEQDNRTTN
jgi:uncharacterized protein with HEPN domain